MGRRLKGSWLRFLQNAEQLDRRGLPCSVEDYINDDTVTHGPGNAQLAELIPNLLTSLGILGTFIGLTRGLTGLDMKDAQSLMDGIPLLLDGMRAAFGTSVAGISCSLVFNMLNRIAQGSSYRAIDDFVESFTQLAMQRPLDNDVQMICQNEDRNHMLFNATDGLAVQMASSIELAVSRAMNPVALTMDQFIAASTRAQVDGVGRIVNRFVEEMNHSLNNQFLNLGKTLTDMNQQQRVGVQQMEETFRAAGSMMSDLRQMHQVSEEIIGHFGAYMGELQSLRVRDEEFEQRTAQLLEQLHQTTLAQETALESVQTCQEKLRSSMETFSVDSAGVLAGLKTESRGTAERYEVAGETMKDASAQLARSYQSFVTDVVEGLSRALGLFDQNMTELMSTFTKEIEKMPKDGVNGQATAKLSEIQRLLASMAGSLEKLTAGKE